jgi:hypothetical protein
LIISPVAYSLRRGAAIQAHPSAIEVQRQHP